MHMDFEEELRKSLAGSPVFRKDGEVTLDRDFIPEKVLHRDEIIKRMLLDFKIVMKENKGVNIGVRGGGGFGKTLVSRFSQQKLKNVADEFGINIDIQYYNCFNHRTLGAILRDYLLDKHMYMSGKGFSISELMTYLIQNLEKKNIKLVIILDEIQNLDTSEIMQLLTINEDFRTNNNTKEFVSFILIARDYDWNNILVKEPRIAQRLTSTYKLEQYTASELFDIYLYRMELAFKEGVFSDDNIELIVDMSETSGNVYYGIELMRHAGKRAEFLHENEVLPEMIRGAAKNVSTEFREPLLDKLRPHELFSLLAVARLLERLSDKNINKITIYNAYNEYKVVCEEYGKNPHVITVFRKHVKKLHQNHLLKQRIVNIKTRGRRGEINIIGFSAELVKKKVIECLDGLSMNEES
ncbi:AAA family ATPase [Candidatus Bathyarchaeota archaeon]|nr:AAA family ATPase [Candidatus Bathyarchaeota archaeon]